MKKKRTSELQRLVAQLFATRTTLEAAAAQIDAQLVALGIDPDSGDPLGAGAAPVQAGGCPHPADRIADESTLDDDGECYRCADCGAEFSTHPHTNPHEE